MPTEPRWRDRPRPRLWQSGRATLDFAVACGAIWVVAVALLAQAVVGDGPWPRWQAAPAGVGLVGVASWMTWVAVLYLGRPLEPDDRSTEDGSRESREPYGGQARADSERRAWRSR